MHETDSKEKIRIYRRRGLEGGVVLGSVMGLLVGATQFDVWEFPLRNSFIAIVSFASIGGLLGFFFLELFKGDLASGYRGGADYSGGSDGGGNLRGGGDG